MAILPRQNDILSGVAGVKDSFSSWDKCMEHDYCKYPVIVAIIIASLIVLSVVLCLARCICCGKDIVCCCWRCCGGRRSHKHLDSVPPTPYNPGYQPGFQPQYQSHAPPVYAGPAAFAQTATFASSSKVHEDSLPAMPSWETAPSRKVEVLEEPPESHEMERLTANGNSSPNLRSNTASPLARPIAMRNDSDHTSLQASPRLPNAAYGTGSRPYGSDANAGPYGSRTNFNGSNAEFQGSRSNLVEREDYPYSPSAYSPTSPSQPRMGYGNDRTYDSRPDQYNSGYNRPSNSPGGYNPPRNNNGYTAYSPANDRYAPTSSANNADRYTPSNTANNGGQRQYGNNPYDRQGPGANSWRDI